jgi:hypothetical protein
VLHSDDGLVSKEELTHMAIKLKQDLIFCEDKLGGHRDFAELRSSANALIRAILEPVEYRLSTSTSAPMKPVQSFPFTPGRKCIPGSLH